MSDCKRQWVKAEDRKMKAEKGIFDSSFILHSSKFWMSHVSPSECFHCANSRSAARVGSTTNAASVAHSNNFQSPTLSPAQKFGGRSRVTNIWYASNFPSPHEHGGSNAAVIFPFTTARRMPMTFSGGKK